MLLASVNLESLSIIVLVFNGRIISYESEGKYWPYSSGMFRSATLVKSSFISIFSIKGT